jgi:hypothetical protein
MVATAAESVFDEIVGVLSRVTDAPAQKFTPATELYYDFRIAGDDLYEVISAIHDRFGTDFSEMDLRYYSPGETEAMFSFDFLRELLGRPRRFRRLNVQMLVDAVEAGRWTVR